MAAKETVANTFELVQKFVHKQKGVWAHADWEAFLGDASSLGYELTAETQRHLGNLLEAAKHLYESASAAASASPVKPAAKAKTAAKPKAAPKPKTAPKAKAAPTKKSV